MIGVKKALDPVLVVDYKYSGDFELLVVEATIGLQNVRIISGYGPQECWTMEERPGGGGHKGRTGREVSND